MRLIDGDEIGLTNFEIVMCEGSYKNALGALIYKISNAPTIDAVLVTRRKDCDKREYCRTSTVWAVAPNDDWYCADGERKEE